MKDELRLEIPNGFITFRVKLFLEEMPRMKIRKMFRLIHKARDLEQEEKEICEWLVEKRKRNGRRNR